MKKALIETVRNKFLAGIITEAKYQVECDKISLSENYKDEEEFKTDALGIIDAVNKCEPGEFDLFGDEKIMDIYTKPTVKKLSINTGILSKYNINFLTRTIKKRDIWSSGDVSDVQKERTFSTAYGSKIQVTPEQNEAFKDAVINLLKKSIK